jgi:general secretion pathway protein G
MYSSPRTSPSPACCLVARAFTLIELLAVLTIIAILSSIVLGAGRRATEAGHAARARAELAALSAALEAYKLQHGDYPRTNDGATLVQSLLGRIAPTGAALSPAGRAHLEAAKFSFSPANPFDDANAVLLDPWGRPYRYAYKTATPWTNPSFVLHSAGPDGDDAPVLRPGGFADASATANADNLYANRY